MLPRGWACDVSWPGDALAAGRRCAVQPLLMIHLTVARLRLDGSAPPGRQVIRVEVGHLPPARATPVRAAAVSISSNGGVTWHRARLVRTGRATFAASFTAAPGSYVTLRIRAADTAGGSITETIQRGYRVAS